MVKSNFDFTQSAGTGWGGPPSGGLGRARTDGKMDTHPLFEKGNQISKGNRGSNAPSAIAQRERNQKLKDHLYHLALNGESEITQVRASEAYLNRTEGMPVQRNMNVNVDSLGIMTNEELEDRATALEHELSGHLTLEENPE